MATGKRYFWMKLKESFMTSDTIDYFMAQPNGANYVVLYQMLCLKTINTDGRLSRQIGEIIIPYDVEKIRRDCKFFTADTIRVALGLYKSFGLIYEDIDGTLVLANHNELVGSETDYTAQKRDQKNKGLPKLGTCKRVNAESLQLPNGKIQYVDEKRYGGNGMKAFDLAGGVCEMCGTDDDLCIHHNNGYSNDPDDLYVLCRICHAQVHADKISVKHNRVESRVENFHTDIRDKILDNRDKENRDEDIEIRGSLSDSDESDCRASAQRIVDEWNKLPIESKVQRMSPDSKRAKGLRARIREYGEETVLKAVSMVYDSDFLLGKKTDFQITFDWFVAPNNFAKVIGGNYNNRKGGGSNGNSGEFEKYSGTKV